MKSRKQHVKKRGFNKTRANKSGGVGSLKLSSTDKTKIQTNIAKLEEINISNETGRSEEISSLLDGIKKILMVKHTSPVYDLGDEGQGPIYDIANTDASPIYDLGDETRIYGLADASPIYDLGDVDELSTSAQQRQKRTFSSLIQEILNSHNIKSKDDLDKYCEGSGRKKFYQEVKDKCLQIFPSVKCNHKDFNSIIRASYEQKLIGYKLYKPSKRMTSAKA